MESPNAPCFKDDSNNIFILPIFCLSATMDRLIVFSPTSVPKFTPKACLSISSKNSSIVRQFIFVFEVSVHRLISLTDDSPKNGASDDPQFPPITVVMPWLAKLSCFGDEKIVQCVSE